MEAQVATAAISSMTRRDASRGIIDGHSSVANVDLSGEAVTSRLEKISNIRHNHVGGIRWSRHSEVHEQSSRVLGVARELTG